MARYTGPAFKKSRALGFSTLENGKELKKDVALHGCAIIFSKKYLKSLIE